MKKVLAFAVAAAFTLSTAVFAQDKMQDGTTIRKEKKTVTKTSKMNHKMSDGKMKDDKMKPAHK